MIYETGDAYRTTVPGSAADVFGPLRVPEDAPAQAPTRFQQMSQRAKETWDNRPDAFEFHFIYVPIYLPIAVAAGALAIGVLDETFHTHIAERMANVQVDKKDGTIERNIEKAIHSLGVKAVEAEK